MFKETLVAIIVLVLIVGLVVGLAFGGEMMTLKFKEFFGVRHADVDRQIFKATKTYNEGMANDLANYKIEYELSDNEVDKQAIRRFIIDKYSDFDASRLQSYSLQQFLNTMRGGF